MDIIIRGGLVADGTGEKPYYADLGINRDRIVKIGSLEGVEADKSYDAKGLVVTPGLIDGHTHSELSLMRNPQHPNALYQGISTVVTGQCGLGFAPMRAEHFEDSNRINSGIFGNGERFRDRFYTFGEYLKQLDKAAVNVGSNVSHNAIRQAACGFSDIPLAGERLEAAEYELRKAMEEGALGFSVGLSYYPGGYSDTQELIALCRTVKEYDGLLNVHLRLDDGQIPISPVEEIVKIIKETSIRVNMLHYKTGGMENVDKLYEPFEEIIALGADVHFEYYPYLSGAGLVLALVPGWAQADGYEAVMSRLTDKKLRPKLLADMDTRRPYFFGEGQDAVIILTKNPYSEYLGKTIGEIAENHGESFSETVIRLLVENELEVGFAGTQNQPAQLQEKLYDDQYKLFMNERYTVGSDTIPHGRFCHPRAFGTFPRIISQMRSRKVPLEYVIHKLTQMPAELYHLTDRGVLKPGKKADICLMDYGKVEDKASYDTPRVKAEGIRTLLVNGLPVLENGTITGILSGEALKRG